jgi:hypothetical protein
MYIQNIQGLFQSRLSTADHALSLVAPATTAVQSLEKLFPFRYIASGLTSQETRPLPGNGCPLLLRIRWNVFT